jgi:hypothetical protein
VGRYDYLDERRIALEKLSEAMAEIAGAEIEPPTRGSSIHKAFALATRSLA